MMGRIPTLLGFLLLVHLVSQHPVFAQDVEKDYFPTPNTLKDAKPDPKKQRDKEKPLRYLITNDTKGTLSGNRCFEEYLAEMGFQYLAIPRGQPLNKNGFQKCMHNTGAKFMIVLKNGPFWKTKVNKRYQVCMYGSGDFVGRLILEDIADESRLEPQP